MVKKSKKTLDFRLTLSDNINMKDERITFRLKSVEKKEIEREAKKAGFDSIAAFLLWLVRNRKK